MFVLHLDNVIYGVFDSLAKACWAINVKPSEWVEQNILNTGYNEYTFKDGWKITVVKH